MVVAFMAIYLMIMTVLNMITVPHKIHSANGALTRLITPATRAVHWADIIGIVFLSMYMCFVFF